MALGRAEHPARGLVGGALSGASNLAGTELCGARAGRKGSATGQASL